MEYYRILSNGNVVATTRDGARAFALAYDCLLAARTLCPNKRPPRIHVTDYKGQILREF